MQKLKYVVNEKICPECQGDGFLSVGEGLYTCPLCYGERFVALSKKGGDSVSKLKYATIATLDFLALALVVSGVFSSRELSAEVTVLGSLLVIGIIAVTFSLTKEVK